MPQKSIVWWRQEICVAPDSIEKEQKRVTCKSENRSCIVQPSTRSLPSFLNVYARGVDRFHGAKSGFEVTLVAMAFLNLTILGRAVTEPDLKACHDKQNHTEAKASNLPNIVRNCCQVKYSSTMSKLKEMLSHWSFCHIGRCTCTEIGALSQK